MASVVHPKWKDGKKDKTEPVGCRFDAQLVNRCES